MTKSVYNLFDSQDIIHTEINLWPAIIIKFLRHLISVKDILVINTKDSYKKS